MTSVAQVALGELMSTKTGSVDPSKYEDEVFDLYSIPAYDRGAPEVAEGSTIGSSKQIVRPRDVLLSKIVPHIRRTWVVGEDRGRRLIASGEWIVFRSPRAEPEYLRQVLRSDPFHVQFMKTVAGVGGSLLRARPAQVARIEIPLPPLPEQRRIAAILDQANALRAKRREALAQLDSLTQSIFTEMFGDPEAGGSSVPVTTLGKVCLRITDGTHQSPKWEPSGIPFIFISNIVQSQISFETNKYISEETYIELTRRCPIEVGDVLYTTVGSYGNVAVVSTSEKFAFQRHIAHIKPDRTKLDSTFCAAMLRSPAIRRQVDRVARGVAQKTVNLADLTSLQVFEPPMQVQRQFARRADAIDSIRAAHVASLAELDSLFDSLQHRAFAGQLS